MRKLAWLALALGGCGEPVQGQVRMIVTNTSAPGDLIATDGSAHDIGLAPGIAVVHDEAFDLFLVGESAGNSLEAIAEDGAPAALVAELSEVSEVSEVFVYSTLDDVDYNEAPLHPGESDNEILTVRSDQRITFLQMFGASNDTFAAGTFSAFDKKALDLGDVTAAIALYDAGTEVNEDPGLGQNQPANQTEPGQGPAEGGVITQVIDGFPAVESFLRVELAAVE